MGLYVERETAPLVRAGHEVMIVFRDHVPSTSQAAIYIMALETNTAGQVVSGMGADTNSFTNITAFTLGRGEGRRIDIPVGSNPIDIVSAVQVTGGAVTVTVVSPHFVTAEFRTRKRP